MKKINFLTIENEKLTENQQYKIAFKLKYIVKGYFCVYAKTDGGERNGGELICYMSGFSKNYTEDTIRPVTTFSSNKTTKFYIEADKIKLYKYELLESETITEER